MIINTKREPMYSLYYLGGIVLHILKKSNNEPIEALFEKCKKEINKDIHIDFFYYALDWLFMISIIELTEGGTICLLKD